MDSLPEGAPLILVVHKTGSSPKEIRILKGPLTHKEDRDRYLYFEDPDGNMIELVASTLANWPASYLR